MVHNSNVQIIMFVLWCLFHQVASKQNVSVSLALVETFEPHRCHLSSPGSHGWKASPVHPVAYSQNKCSIILKWTYVIKWWWLFIRKALTGRIVQKYYWTDFHTTQWKGGRCGPWENSLIKSWFNQKMVFHLHCPALMGWFPHYYFLSFDGGDYKLSDTHNIVFTNRRSLRLLRYITVLFLLWPLCFFLS